MELVRHWLATFGPAATADIVWWTGLGITEVRAALAALDVVTVDLGGQPGVVLPDDVDAEPDVEPWVALLPSLDPTPMGWKTRGAISCRQRHLHGVEVDTRSLHIDRRVMSMSRFHV